MRIRQRTAKLADAPPASRREPQKSTGAPQRIQPQPALESGRHPRATLTRKSRAPIYWSIGVVAIVCLVAFVVSAVIQRDRLRGDEVPRSLDGQQLLEQSPPTSSSAALPTSARTVGEILAGLEVGEERPDGYERVAFEHWIDDDNDGCDTRDEVLILESEIGVDVTSGCQISSGRWFSEYDGVVVSLAGDLDIDHVIPLKEAWDSGAFDWSSERRRAFANDLGDPLALRAVTAASNRSKSDRDPSEWLPFNEAAICSYLEAWVEIKARWSLRVDVKERDSIAASIARSCTE